MGSMVSYNPSFFKGKKVLITGDTGFKGSWLAIWLINIHEERYNVLTFTSGNCGLMYAR